MSKKCFSLSILLLAGLICCVLLAWSIYRLQPEEEAYDRGVWFEEHGDPDQAFLWFQRAASEGDLDGKDMLGYCYVKGMGTARNYRKALVLFQETAWAGSALGAFNLAIAYESGHGTPRDMQQAFFWYRKSAERGDPDAMYELAQCYRTGSGAGCARPPRKTSPPPCMRSAWNIWKKAMRQKPFPFSARPWKAVPSQRNISLDSAVRKGKA